MNPRKQFRKLLSEAGLIVAPGAYDVLSAILVEDAGFPAIYFGSMAASATLLGAPDIGLIACPEYVSMAAKIAGRVNIPLIADAEDGYGDLFSVQRTVREYERAGVSAMHIEDHLYGKHIDMEHGRCVEIQDMVIKIKAACDARTDPDTVIIARTDSLWAYRNFEQTLERACAYAEAGADMLFIAQLKEEDIERTARIVGVPILNTSGFSNSSHKELEQKGLKVLIYFTELMLASLFGVKEYLSGLLEKDGPVELLGKELCYQEIDEAIRIEQYRELYRKYQ